MNIEQEIQNILDRNFTRGDNANALKELLVLYSVVFNEAEIDEDIVVNIPHKTLGKYSLKKIEDSEVELCECSCPLIRTGTKEKPEYCGNCGKDI